MSSFEHHHEADAQLHAAAATMDALASAESAPGISPAALRAAIGAVVRLYERACVDARAEITPVADDVPTTAAIGLACALSRSQNLTPFDLALWFSHTAPRTAPEPFVGGAHVEGSGR